MSTLDNFRIGFSDALIRVFAFAMSLYYEDDNEEEFGIKHLREGIAKVNDEKKAGDTLPLKVKKMLGIISTNVSDTVEDFRHYDGPMRKVIKKLFESAKEKMGREIIAVGKKVVPFPARDHKADGDIHVRPFIITVEMLLEFLDQEN